MNEYPDSHTGENDWCPCGAILTQPKDPNAPRHCVIVPEHSKTPEIAARLADGRLVWLDRDEVRELVGVG